MSDRPIRIDDSIPGVRVAVFRKSAPHPLRIRTDKAMEDWTPLVVDPLRDDSPPVPTAIEYGENLYAIMKVERHRRGWQYWLVPWPESEMVRRRILLSREEWERVREEERLLKERERRDLAVRGLGFLIAFLPAALQNEIGSRYDYDPSGWTRVNAAVIGLITLSVTVVNYVVAPITAAFGFGGGYPSHPAAILVPYLAIDSLIRYGHALTADRPVGLLPLELISRLYLWFRR